MFWTDGESPAFLKKFHIVHYVPEFLELICLFWWAIYKMLYVQFLSVAAEEGGILIETAAFANFELWCAPLHQTFASVIEADINESASPRWHLYCDILQGL